MTIPASVTQEEWDVFLAETQEQLDSLEAATLRLEQDDADAELLREMFRLAHTIKGSSAAVGLESMTTLTHAMESLLDRLRGNQLDVSPPLIDALFQGCDLLHRLVMMPTIEDGVEPDIDPLVAQLQELADDTSPAAAPTEAALPVAPASTDRADSGAQQTLAANLTLVASPTATLVEPQRAPSSTSVRINVDRLDTLMELVGELVIDRERIERIASQLDPTARTGIGVELGDVYLHLRRTLDDLRDEVLKSRMVPVSSVLRRLPRVVRDIAQASGKEVDLRMGGEGTELDRAVADELADPLVHLVRNAVDHGIEPPEDRERQGKPRVGTIDIRARHDENQILLELSDDGRGIDVSRVREVATARRLISGDATQHMSDADLMDLIFIPGFSTATTVTAVSGRGVGMDIVRSRIERVNGSITIDSNPGEGTRFTIRLPLTLAIIRGLLVELRDQVYAIPLTSVAEVLRIPRADVRSVARRPAIDLRGEVLPLVWLDELLAVPPRAEERDPLIGVSIRAGGRRVGIVVDSLIGEQDIVIKPLGAFIGKARGIAGATILVDGRVCPILNVAGLLAASTIALSRSEAS